MRRLLPLSSPCLIWSYNHQLYRLINIKNGAKWKQPCSVWISKLAPHLKHAEWLSSTVPSQEIVPNISPYQFTTFHFYISVFHGLHKQIIMCKLVSFRGLRILLPLDRARLIVSSCFQYQQVLQVKQQNVSFVHPSRTTHKKHFWSDAPVGSMTSLVWAIYSCYCWKINQFF